MFKKKKDSGSDKPSFHKAYKDIRGFGDLPDNEKKETRAKKFRKLIGKK